MIRFLNKVNHVMQKVTLSRMSFFRIVKIHKQEGHDGPISPTWIMLYIALLTEM